MRLKKEKDETKIDKYISATYQKHKKAPGIPPDAHH